MLQRMRKRNLIVLMYLASFFLLKRNNILVKNVRNIRNESYVVNEYTIENVAATCLKVVGVEPASHMMPALV